METENDIVNKNCILIVDDDFINRELLKNVFSSQYTFEEAGNGEEGLLQTERHLNKLCAIILDVQMPKMNGIELLEILNDRGITDKIPTFLITAQDDDELVSAAYGLGVVDVVSKPVTPVVIQKRVKMVIELFSARETLSATVKGQEQKLSENAREMDELNKNTIVALATAIEFRDIETGKHVSRIYGATKYILSSTSFGDGLSESDIESIARGAIMHDVGKIAISDVILNKPSKLTKEEFEIMKLHTVKGAALLAQISQGHVNDSYDYAYDIARHHHERYDGRGYPDGLKGDEISVAAQVVSIIDVYDALTSDRVYKKAYTYDKAVDMIKNGECGMFNPKLLECFLEAEPTLRKWYAEDDQSDMPSNIGENAKQINAVYNSMTEGGELNTRSSSVMDVMLLMSAVQTAYDMIISVNLTQNSYYMIDYDRFLTHCVDNGGVFDDLIDLGAASVPISHRKEFRDTFCRENLLQAYASGAKTVSLEHPQYSDTGELHWVSTRVMFMENKRTGDILQITLARYIDDERAQKERTRKVLTEALKLAEKANSAKSDFLSRMSHDIRTPLNAIIGMTTIIAAHINDPEKINECLVKIGTSSKFLLGIINDILDYSKIENGRLSINKADFNVRDMVVDVSESINMMAQAKQQNFSFAIDDKIATSYIGDEYRIRQILVNFLDNAYKYTPEGGSFSLDVSLSRRTSEYDVLEFVVEDSGCGIREEFLPTIFEPFSQEKRSDNIGSVGLGLAITRNLAHLMNGDVGVASKVGEGSRFTFELPVEQGKLTAASEPVNTDIRVLVVDDDISVCEHTSVLLHNMGISAQLTDNGFDAIEMVKANVGTPEEFDVAIIDWKMPNLDGIETVRRIRRIVGRNVLVVVMSAYDWTEIEEEAREAGVDLFIAKPILEINLRTAIACSERIIREKTSVSFNGEKIIVAEDNAFNAEVAKAILEMKNLHVEIAADGKQAYDMFVNSKKGEYLAILMDVLMPVMDGHEASRAIRASNHPDAKTIPIYAVTANAFRNDIFEAKLAGMNAHIAKPVDFDEVARMLAAIGKNNK